MGGAADCRRSAQASLTFPYRARADTVSPNLCGLHAGPPPTGPQLRRTLYLQHYSPRAFDLIGPYQGYNQIMPGYGEGQIPNIEEMQAQVGS